MRGRFAAVLAALSYCGAACAAGGAPASTAAAGTVSAATVSGAAEGTSPATGTVAGHIGVATLPGGSTAGSASPTVAPTNGTTLGALPAPPPSSVALPPQGVPPTPAPATPGLPAPSSSTRVLPSSTGLGAQIDNELRPAGSASVAQVADVQAALAAGGLYRGPVDGVFSSATRAAIRQFQSLERLPDTGELDSETLARITTGRSPSTPVGSGGGLGAGVGSNGTTATAGNPSTVDPFTTLPVGTPITTTGSVIARTPVGAPFPLSQPLNLSPEMAPPGVLVQP
jgi:hypothetical protein